MGEGIGILCLVDKNIDIQGKILGEEGRIIGLKFQNMQIWNIYPISDSGNKKRENCSSGKI